MRGVRFGNNERRLRNGMRGFAAGSRKATDFREVGWRWCKENIQAQPKLQPASNLVYFWSPALAPGANSKAAAPRQETRAKVTGVIAISSAGRKKHRGCTHFLRYQPRGELGRGAETGCGDAGASVERDKGEVRKQRPRPDKSWGGCGESGADSWRDKGTLEYRCVGTEGDVSSLR